MAERAEPSGRAPVLGLLINEQGSARPTWRILTRALIDLQRRRRGRMVVVRGRERLLQKFRVVEDGVPYYAVGLMSLPGHSLVAALQLAWIFWREGVEVAHLHLPYWDGWGYWLYCLLRPTPFLVTIHSWNPGRAAARHPWAGVALRLLLQRALHVTTVSRAAAEDLCAWVPGVRAKLRVVPNGADAPGFSRSLSRPAPGPFLLWAGSLFFQKGTDVLLFALHDLARRGRLGVRAVVCGQDLTSGGLYQDMARRLGLGHMVEFRGLCSHEAVLQLNRECLFFVSPSRGESCSLAVLEAMAAGKAVAAPGVGGMAEIVEDGVTGLLYACGDPAALAGAIERLSLDGELRERLGRNAAEAAAGRTWAGASSAYSELHGDALVARRRRP